MLLNKFASESAMADVNLEKLKRIQQYAEADSCRRKILLNYFSENLPNNCGNCDVCANPRKHFDGTLMIQKALSAVMRMGEKEGFNMLIDVLKGSKRQEIVLAGYDKLKTHGVGAEIPASDWQRYIMQMLNLGILEMAYDENFALKVTPIGKEILFGKEKMELSVLQTLQAADKPIRLNKAPSLSSEEELFNLLKKVRTNLAVAENVPAYVIFSDATLSEMVKEKPLTLSDLLLISGVGEHKLEKYGQDFLNALIDFNRPKGTKSLKGSTYVETLKLYQQNVSINEIAKQRNLAIPTVFSHLAALYLSGDVKSLSQFVNEDEVIHIKEAMQQIGETKAMKPIFEHLKEAVTYPKIRLAMAILEKRKG